MKQWNLSALIKNHKKDDTKWNYGKWMLNQYKEVEFIWWHTNDKENYVFKETETHRHTTTVIHILRKRCSKQRFYWKSIFHWFDHLIWFDQSIIQLQAAAWAMATAKLQTRDSNWHCNVTQLTMKWPWMELILDSTDLAI